MFAMFRQFFATITLFFIATEKIASASNHLATWADESAGAFADEARITRATKLSTLNADLVHTKAINSQAKQLPTPKPTARKTK